MTTRVLVTGGSGFIAGHCILQLLASGYQVRATVRSLTREASVRSVLIDAGMVNEHNLSFVAADLMRDGGWAEAMQGVDFVLHVASPVQPGHVDDEDDLIVPAREGALRVLRAAWDAGVERVVLTSAFHAVSWGHPHTDRVFTEADWTVLDGPGVDAYGKSKTLAEQAAWEFMKGTTGPMELVTMLPVAVMGPVMGNDVSGSNHLIQSILNGGMPAFPHLFFPIVDVRDVARAHILAMTTPDAAGQRFLLSNGPAVEMKDIGATIRARLGAAARNVPTRTVPNIIVRIASVFSPQFRSIAPDLGYAKKTSNEKARRVLGWTSRDPEEAIVAAAESMVKKGLVNK
ncbi:SDR family oxidoreductase [Nonomuraea lactucae]|uniref:SDR family oxidoreductase n=1 Tax=Nonomuraea lactucae TaxID=2249762 RepID=UPI000DE3FEF0|nr:aldehyde reductase [Nonomuraea lactucae]